MSVDDGRVSLPPPGVSMSKTSKPNKLLFQYVMGRLGLMWHERALRGAIISWLGESRSTDFICSSEPDIVNAAYDDAAYRAIKAGREPTIDETRRAVIQFAPLEYRLDDDAIEDTAEALADLAHRLLRTAQRLRLDRPAIEAKARIYIDTEDIFPACLQLQRRRGRGRGRAFEGLDGLQDENGDDGAADALA